MIGVGKTLVLGANGTLGRLLQKAWAPRDDMLYHARDGLADICFDILQDPSALERAINAAKSVICLAGVTPSSAQPRPFDDNSRVAEAVLKAAGSRPCLFMSTAAVYGDGPQNWSETDPTEPLSDYGASKLEMERIVSAANATATCLRLGNVIGADALLGTARDAYFLDQLEDGTFPVRSYIGPDLLSDILLSLSDQMTNGAQLPAWINIATPEPVTLNALLDAASATWSPRPAPEGIIARVSLQTKRLQNLVTLPEACSAPKALIEDWRKATSHGTMSA
jgi:nucleoside-diphosphate-sugar epimerase